MQTAEIGFFSLTINERKFSLIPSLRNMAKLADSKRLLLLYEMIHSNQVPDWLRVNIGRDILIACSDKESIEEHLIRCKKQKPHIKPNSISMNDQVLVAAALMRHGIAGVNRPKYAGNKKKSKPMDKFDVNQIVSQAMIHFGLSKNEALDLTMSEFCHLLAAKFPPESVGEDAPTLDDHKAVMKALMENNNG